MTCNKSLDERFFAKVVAGPNCCWIWAGALDSGGYGQFRVGPKTVRSHRWSYEYAHGSIPDGMELDHICRVRRCVNPAHLEPVTKGENQRRGWVHRKKDVCRNGHARTEKNTRINPDGSRGCRPCGRETQRRYVERQSA